MSQLIQVFANDCELNSNTCNFTYFMHINEVANRRKSMLHWGGGGGLGRGEELFRLLYIWQLLYIASNWWLLRIIPQLSFRSVQTFWNTVFWQGKTIDIIFYPTNWFSFHCWSYFLDNYLNKNREAILYQLKVGRECILLCTHLLTEHPFSFAPVIVVLPWTSEQLAIGTFKQEEAVRKTGGGLRENFHTSWSFKVVRNKQWKRFYCLIWKIFSRRIEWAISRLSTMIFPHRNLTSRTYI